MYKILQVYDIWMVNVEDKFSDEFYSGINFEQITWRDVYRFRKYTGLFNEFEYFIDCGTVIC